MTTTGYKVIAFGKPRPNGTVHQETVVPTSEGLNHRQALDAARRHIAENTHLETPAPGEAEPGIIDHVAVCNPAKNGRVVARFVAESHPVMGRIGKKVLTWNNTIRP